MKIGAMKIRIAILEDDTREAEETCTMLARFFRNSIYAYSVETYSSSAEFLSLPFVKYDLLFLDILLDGEEINGVDVANKIREQNPLITLVFLTKSIHFAVDGYKVNAVDYIVKPLVYEEFLLKMHKIIDIMSHVIDKDILLKSVDGVARLKESDIVYVEVIKHYLHFHCKDGRVIIARGTIKDYADELSTRFARCGNSFIVNLSYVAKIGKTDVFVSYGDDRLETVPLTKSFRDSFLLTFTEYCGV